MKFRLLSISLALFFLAVTASVFAQEGSGCSKQCNKQQQRPDKIDKLSHHLELSDEQIKTLKEGFDSELTREEKKALFSQVLTEEQQATLASCKPKHSLHRRHRGHHRTHHHDKRVNSDKRINSEVNDKLIEMRTELEASISEEDRATLAEIRADLRAMRAEAKKSREEWNEKSDEEKLSQKRELKSNWQEKREKREARIKTLRTLREKYDEEITSLFTENESFFNEKQEERKIERHEKFQQIQDEKRRLDVQEYKRQQRYRGHRPHRMQTKKVRFLLMEANVPSLLVEEIAPQKPSTLSISPNPANGQTTLAYNLPTDREIKIELRNEQGQLIEVIDTKSLTAGSYEKTLNTTQLQSQLYLVTLWDGVEMITKKLIIQK